jgi:lipopolysaccharide export system protein LptC
MTRLSTTSALDESRDRSFAGSARLDGQRAFQRAMRHSRYVRILRVAIPAIAILFLIGAMLAKWLDPLNVLARLPASAQGVVISGTKITMEAPKLSGYTRDSRWYELTARSAAQDITKPSLIELNDVRGRIEAEDRSQMYLTAKDGIYDRKSGMLTLQRDIKLISSSGITVRLDEAVINTNTNEIVSNSAVAVETEQSKIKADRLEVAEGGEVIRFIGGVVMNLAGAEAPSPPAPLGPAPAKKR